MFCPNCGTLLGAFKICRQCSRLPPDDEGTKKQEPPKPPTTPANPQWKKCKGCGGKVSPRSKFDRCFECRGAQDPAVASEKEYDENHPEG